MFWEEYNDDDHDIDDDDHGYNDVEVSKCILNEFLIKFWVYNMCHVSVWIFDLLLAGLLGYVIFEVHQVLLQSLEDSQSIRNEFLVKF